MRVRKEAFGLMAGWDEIETKKLFKEFFEQEIKPRIYPQSVNLIKSYINQGYEVILTSASLFEIVEELKEYLSLKFVISTKLETANAKYTGRIFGEVPYGENKVKEVKNLLRNNEFVMDGSYAYADHHSDLPVLELVENPVAVNPDRQLRKIAQSKKWNIYDYK